jgi:hypothetical protein
MKIKSTLFFVFIFSTLFCFPQGQQFQNNNWYFGNGATMSFQNNGAPILGSPTTSLFTDEGSSSISDINGTLLFYTDGGTVWDANDAVMANGTNIQGFGYGGSSVQSSIIIKKPGSSNLYYIFCVAESGAPSTPFSYSIVDMSLNGGLGVVTSKSNIIFNGTSEKIAATYHCNGTDIWIATHDLNTNNYRTVLLSSTGVSAPVITSIGPIITGNVLGNSTEGVGSMKFTSDGLHLAMSNITSPDVLDLLTFNKSTGVFSNRLDIYNSADADGVYGLEFSPNNQVLYVANYILSELFQYDISSGVAATILASRTSVGQPFDRGINQLQLAIDGKIYAAQRRADLPIGVVNSPNALGVACNWDNAGFDPLGSGLPSAFGLPSQLIIIPTKFNYQNTPDEIILCKTNSVTPNFYSPYPVNNGVFSCPSAGLVFNTSTGVVNAAASTVGTYTLTFAAPLSGCVSPFFSTYKISIINCNDVCLVQNHSFEYDSSVSYYTGWQPSWTGAGFPGDSTEINQEIVYGGASANNVAEIDAEAWLSQSISGFVIGNSYQLFFLASRRLGLDPSPATTIIDVKIDGGALTSTCTQTNTMFSLTAQSYNFVATQTTHLLSLKPTAATILSSISSGMIIDDIDICPLIILPIELVSFTVQCSTEHFLKFNWSTEMETTNDYFTIEGSRDGIIWSIIKDIDGAGNSSNVNFYSYYHPLDNMEISYYRLKQTDFDGRSKTSDIISVDCKKISLSEYSVYPNPFTNSITISGKNISRLEIVNCNGAIVHASNYSSINEVNLSLSDLSKGIYFINIISNSRTIEHKKIFKLN